MSSLWPVRGGFARSVLVALTLLGVAGHICVLPSAAEVVAAGPSQTHHQGQDDGSDGSHLASCNATVSRALASAPGVSTQLQLAAVAQRFEHALAASRERRANSDRMPGSASGLPLFILHASLLI